MPDLDIQKSDSLAVITMQRGKVNAINNSLVDDLRSAFTSLESDPNTSAIVLTGSGPFFSFGLDVPELYDLPPDRFAAFLRNFTDLCRSLFIFPKPLVAAINGHAIAGGCILATTCDRRLMLTGKPRISLNELTFGSTIFTTAIELMRYWTGSRLAEQIIFDSAMHSADDAHALGLVDTLIPSQPDLSITATPPIKVPNLDTSADSQARPPHVSALPALLSEASETALGLCSANPAAFAHTKSMLRQPIINHILALEEPTIQRFVDIWYSEPVRTALRQITIR